MKLKPFLYSATALISLSSASQAELIFSEYIEGSSNNKALEIYNPTSTDIDLSSYSVVGYQNGGTDAGYNVDLSGTLTAGSVYIIAHGSADAEILAKADQEYSLQFNGDDVVTLQNNGVTVDSIGKIGEDPGSEWGSDDTTTKDHTLRRLSNITSGDTDPSDDFDPATEWQSFTQNTFDGLGAHGASIVEDGMPVANAGSNQTGVAAGALITLDGSASFDTNSDGSIIDYTWTQTAGTTVVLETTDPALPSFTAPLAEDTLTFTLTVTDNDGNTATDTVTISVDAPLVSQCNAQTHLISEIQGSGETSPIVGEEVTIQAVVTKVLPELSGYMVQEEDADSDADSTTSEGIFVYDYVNTPSVGDVVSVVGTVNEYYDLTQINSVSNYDVCDTGASITPTPVSLPFAAETDIEMYEGMLISFPQELTVTETYTLGRFGQVALSSSGKLMNPTQVAAPGDDAVAQLAANELNRILMDDGSNAQNATISYPGFGELTFDNPIRSGYTITDFTGVVNYTFSTYSVVPTADVAFTETNARTETPEDVGGEFKVAGFNVLNYFTTLASAGSEICGDGDTFCRGADDETEFERQNAKIISALSAIDADIFGLIEIENNAADTAVATLVDNLNAVAGADTYSYINTGMIGEDAIKQALIYKSASVAPVGDFEIVDYGDEKNRPSLIQSFKAVDGSDDDAFVVVVNHLKSKGSDCDELGDPDTGDGQGNCNLTRLSAVQTLLSTLEGMDNQNILLLGDFNSYAMEDPITALKDAGYVDLGADAGETASYVFDGEWGTLDYAFASASLVDNVTDTTEWHINADEPISFDYNTDFKAETEIASYYGSSAYRSSDHDPVIVGLNVTPGYGDSSDDDDDKDGGGFAISPLFMLFSLLGFAAIRLRRS
ncbi:ExeM/NucH family extracellular endonuclease [Leucothrix sargassi]|nr:ExeM/NucH family extracellular endonuclease [Leucothrix sargassi]